LDHFDLHRSASIPQANNFSLSSKILPLETLNYLDFCKLTGVFDWIVGGDSSEADVRQNAADAPPSKAAVRSKSANLQLSTRNQSRRDFFCMLFPLFVFISVN
jgi:hypothetical protein